MKSKLNNPLLGLILGIITPLLAVIIFYYINGDYTSFIDFFLSLKSMGISAEMLSLLVVPNLGVFFLFMSKNYYLSGKGVIAATFIWVIIDVIIKFAVK